MLLFFPLFFLFYPLVTFHFKIQEIGKVISKEKNQTLLFPHTPQPSVLTRQHTHIPAFLPNSPGSAEPVSRQRFSLASPTAEHPTFPASPAPRPIPPSTSPLRRQTRFLARPSRGNRMWVSVPKHARPAAPAAPVRLHRAACVLLGHTVCFCGQDLAVPATAGRSWELALAIDTDLPKLVLCQVSHFLLEHLSMCPLSPFQGVFLCLSELKKPPYFAYWGLLGLWGGLVVLLASWWQPGMRTVAVHWPQAPSILLPTGVGNPGLGAQRSQGLSPAKLPAAAPRGHWHSPAAAFPALWKNPPSCRRLPLTQTASLPDGPCLPQPAPKKAPLFGSANGAHAAG